MEIEDAGSPVGASCDIERVQANWSLVLHSRGGTLGTPNVRNPGYLPALELILHRLAIEGATLVNVLLDTKETVHLTINERRLLEQAPVDLTPETDVGVLRKEITQNSARKTSLGKDQRSGNPTKRIRLLFSFPIEYRRGEVISRIVHGQLDGPVDPEVARGNLMNEPLQINHADEIQAEQKYLNEAWSHRERERNQWGDAAEGGASSSDQSQIRNISDGVLGEFPSENEPAAFGRIDAMDNEYPVVYVGERNIRDEKSDLFVYDWRSPPASPFYKASIEEPIGLKRKRTFAFNGLDLVDFFDINFEGDRQTEHGVERGKRQSKQVDDYLLAELDRSRSGEMRDIARTIQARQFELISAKIDQVLIIQGGPGTGKTAVALHRLSWILFNYPEIPTKDVLVIGPNTTFLRFIKAVLPALGDQDIPQRDIASLGSDGIPMRVADEPEVVKLKGSFGMTSILKAALKEKIKLPTSTINVSIRARRCEISHELIRRRVEQLSAYCFNDGRREFRTWLNSEIAQDLRMDPDEVRRETSKIADSIWPLLNSRNFVYELLSSRERLLDALLEVGGVHQGGEDWQALLRPQSRRPSASKPDEQLWSESDIPLLDFADQLINGKPPKQYDYIVVDEAQDLSPMQMLMIDRRSARGAITFVGDIAQSTGPFSRSTWDEVIEMMSNRLPVTFESLNYGYRLPSEIHRFLDPLRRLVAPGLEDVEPVRSSGIEPRLFQVGDDRRLNDVFDECLALVELHAKTIGIICPDLLVDALLTKALKVGVQSYDVRSTEIREGVNIVPVSLCKGIEFDAVVVVDPETIAASDDDGLRRLYIAMTRTTRFLSVFYALAPLPGYDGWPAEAIGDRAGKINGVERGIGSKAGRRSEHVIDTAVEEIVDVLRSLTPELRLAVLNQAEARILDKK